MSKLHDHSIRVCRGYLNDSSTSCDPSCTKQPSPSLPPCQRNYCTEEHIHHKIHSVCPSCHQSSPSQPADTNTSRPTCDQRPSKNPRNSDSSYTVIAQLDCNFFTLKKKRRACHAPMSQKRRPSSGIGEEFASPLLSLQIVNEKLNASPIDLL